MFVEIRGKLIPNKRFFNADLFLKYSPLILTVQLPEEKVYMSYIILFQINQFHVLLKIK
jgi:hypothetical protein